MNSDATSNTTPLIATRMATVRRIFSAYPSVISAKIGAMPSGFTMGSSAAKINSTLRMMAFIGVSQHSPAIPRCQSPGRQNDFPSLTPIRFTG